MLNSVFGLLLAFLSCMSLFTWRRMLREGNIQHCTIATCLLLFTFSNTVASQRVTEDHADLPDAAGVVEAYMLARQWIDRFETPPLDDPAARVTIQRATGVCVMLRNAGRVVGTGTAIIGSGMEPELMLRRAIGRALSEVLGDPAVAILPIERRSEIGRTLTLEIEVAGPFQPLLGRAFHQIAQQIEPGLDGVAMRRGDARAMLFPSQLRATNAAGNLQGRLPGLAVEIGLTPADLASLQSRHNVTMHRFRTTHLAQESPSRFPFETFRGDRIVTMHDVTPESIASFADGLAAHLIGKRWSDSVTLDDNEHAPRGLKGDYNPVADTYRPIVTTAFDLALAAFALIRYSSTPGVGHDTAQEAHETAIALLKDLASRNDSHERPTSDPGACAVILMLLAEHAELTRESDSVVQLSSEVARVVYGAFDREVGFGIDGLSIPPHTQAMLANAFAQRLLHPEAALKPVDLEYVRDAIDTAWESVPKQDHVSLLPWIGWAEIAYARAVREPIANVHALREVRTALEGGRELVRMEQPDDLRGGFLLTVGIPSSEDMPPSTGRPTAHSSRPAALFATMLRESSFTAEDERREAIDHHMETMRFLMQLSVRDSLAWLFRHPQAALGGVRASAWDLRLPTAAQAMALLTATETLRSQRAIEPAP